MSHTTYDASAIPVNTIYQTIPDAPPILYNQTLLVQCLGDPKPSNVLYFDSVGNYKWAKQYDCDMPAPVNDTTSINQYCAWKYEQPHEIKTAVLDKNFMCQLLPNDKAVKCTSLPVTKLMT